MHPFVESSLAALARDAKRLRESLEMGDLATARAIGVHVVARIEALAKLEIRLLSEARRESQNERSGNNGARGREEAPSEGPEG